MTTTGVFGQSPHPGVPHVPAQLGVLPPLPTLLAPAMPPPLPPAAPLDAEADGAPAEPPCTHVWVTRSHVKPEGHGHAFPVASRSSMVQPAPSASAAPRARRLQFPSRIAPQLPVSS